MNFFSYETPSYFGSGGARAVGEKHLKSLGPQKTNNYEEKDAVFYHTPNVANYLDLFEGKVKQINFHYLILLALNHRIICLDEICIQFDKKKS